MLKKLVNEAYCTLRITTTGPLLIRSGLATGIGPDMTPVLTNRNNQQEIFLPGSSLKGVFRSHSEKIACSLKSRAVCYPFFRENEKKEVDREQPQRDYRDSCSGYFTDLSKDEKSRDLLERRTDLVYHDSCPTCRLYGSTGFIGRIAIGDAYLVSKQKLEQRDGVGIDRLTGGASNGAKFQLEVVSSEVVFETEIHLRNFEIWQLGMLFIVLQDMQDGLIRIGSGRSRGLGNVTAQIREEGQNGRPGGFVVSSMRGGQEPQGQLWGLGRWLNDNSYGTRRDDLLDTLPAIDWTPRGIRRQRAFSGDALQTLQNRAIDDYVRRITDWPEENARALPAAVRAL